MAYYTYSTKAEIISNYEEQLINKYYKNDENTSGLLFYLKYDKGKYVMEFSNTNKGITTILNSITSSQSLSLSYNNNHFHQKLFKIIPLIFLINDSNKSKMSHKFKLLNSLKINKKFNIFDKKIKKEYEPSTINYNKLIKFANDNYKKENILINNEFSISNDYLIYKKKKLFNLLTQTNIFYDDDESEGEDYVDNKYHNEDNSSDEDEYNEEDSEEDSDEDSEEDSDEDSDEDSEEDINEDSDEYSDEDSDEDSDEYLEYDEPVKKKRKY